MKISIIVAIDQKRGIGKAGKLPWNIPEDLKHFKEITNGHTIIMGRKTFESIGRVLPNRTSIIITRDENFKAEGAIIAHSLNEALSLARRRLTRLEEVFIIGGGQVFKEALEKDLVDKIYLTKVLGDFNCDTFFPDYSNFKKISEENFESGKNKGRFIILEK